MTREAQLQSCKICIKREFLMEKGIVCSLTGEHADFENECKDLEVDEKALQKEEVRKLNVQNDTLKDETGGLNQIGIKNGGVAGAIIMTLGLLWLFGGLIYLNRIFFYSFIIIVIGISLIVKHFIKLNKKNKREAFLRKQSDILDINDLN